MQIPVTWVLFIFNELDSFHDVQDCNFISSYHYVCLLINRQSVTAWTTHQSQKCTWYCSHVKHQITTPWRSTPSPQKTVFRSRSESIHSSSSFPYTTQILIHMTYQINLLIFVPKYRRQVFAKISCFPWENALLRMCSSSKTGSIPAACGDCAKWTCTLMGRVFCRPDNSHDSHSKGTYLQTLAGNYFLQGCLSLLQFLMVNSGRYFKVSHERHRHYCCPTIVVRLATG
jgi:hypothetical protein